jgi:ubiquitin carboxyl-terminal hydrolase L3
MKQTVGNACGVIAAVHALAAAAPHLPPAGPGSASPFLPGSFLEDFLADAPRLEGPAARGARLEHPPGGAPDISGAAADAGAAGQTAAPTPDADVDTHFVALVPAVLPDEEGKDAAWRLVELDGRKAFPIDHGPLTSGRSLDSLLADAARVARAAMDAASDSIQFSLMALVGGGGGGEGEEEGGEG